MGGHIAIAARTSRIAGWRGEAGSVSLRAMSLHRRRFLASAALAGAASLVPGWAVRAAEGLKPMTAGLQPISVAERRARVAKAQALMRAQGIGALLVEPGSSLDYFTGVQWWRS